MYAVWNVETGNLLGQYASEHDALDAVGRLIIANGTDYAGELVLAREDANGLPESIDAGRSLAQRVFTASYQAASRLTGSYQHTVFISAHAGINETMMTREWSTGVTFDAAVPVDFDVLIYRENVHTRWFTTAPVPRSRPDEETKQPANKQPALALAA
jgi:hypothetical protein